MKRVEGESLPGCGLEMRSPAASACTWTWLLAGFFLVACCSGKGSHHHDKTGGADSGARRRTIPGFGPNHLLDRKNFIVGLPAVDFEPFYTYNPKEVGSDRWTGWFPTMLHDVLEFNTGANFTVVEYDPDGTQAIGFGMGVPGWTPTSILARAVGLSGPYPEMPYNLSGGMELGLPMVTDLWLVI